MSSISNDPLNPPSNLLPPSPVEEGSPTTSSFSIDSLSSSSLDPPRMSMIAYSKLMSSTINNFERQLGASDIVDKLAQRLAAFSQAEIAEAAYTRYQREHDIFYGGAAEAAAAINQAISTLNSQTPVYNAGMTSDPLITNPIDTYNTAITPGLANDLTQTTALNSAISSYNSSLNAYQNATNTYNAGVELYNTGAITALEFQTTYADPYNNAITTYNAAVNQYNLALATYQTYLNSRNSALDAAGSLLNASLSPYQTEISTWNNQISALSPPSIPTIPPLPTPSLLPDGTSVSMANFVPTVTPDAPLLTVDTPAVLAPLAQPNLLLSQANLYSDVNAWFNQVISLYNSGQIDLGQFISFESIYNDFIDSYNARHASIINTYEAQVNAYNAIIAENDAILAEYNRVIKRGGVAPVPLEPLAPTPSGLPHYTLDGFPLDNVSSFSPIPLNSNIITLPFIGFFTTILIEMVSAALAYTTFAALKLVTKNNNEYHEQTKIYVLNHGGQPTLPPSYIRPMPDLKINATGGASGGVGLATLATGLDDVDLDALLSKAAWEASIDKELNPPFKDQVTLGMATVLNQAALGAALPSLSTLSSKLGSIDNDGPAARAAFALNFASIITSTLANSSIDKTLKNQLENEVGKGILTEAEVQNFSAAVQAGILTAALSSISQALKLPGLFPQLLGNVPGLDPQAVLSAANAGISLSNVISNPIQQGLTSQYLSDKLQSIGFSEEKANSLSDAVIAKLAAQGAPNTASNLSETISALLLQANVTGGISPALAASLGLGGSGIIAQLAIAKGVSFEAALHAPGSIDVLKQGLIDKLINEGINPLAAEAFVNRAVGEVEAISPTDKASFATSLTESLSSFNPLLTQETAYAIATQTSAFVEAETKLPFLDTSILPVPTKLAIADEKLALTVNEIAKNATSLRELRDFTERALIKEGVNQAEALKQANQAAEAVYKQINSAFLEKQSLLDQIAKAGSDQDSLQSIAKETLIQKGLSESDATLLAEKAKASLDPDSINAYDIRSLFAANLLVQAQRTLREVSLEVVEEFAKNVQEVNERALSEVKQRDLLSNETLRTLLIDTLTNQLTGELGVQEAQKLASDLTFTLLGSPNAVAENERDRPLSLLNQLADHAETLEKQANGRAIEALTAVFKEKFITTLEIYKFNEELRNPANNLLYSGQTGLMYAQNKSLSSYKELDILV